MTILEALKSLEAKDRRIAKLEALVPRWIPCSERMPEEGVCVLLNGKFVGVVTGCLHNGRFYDDNGSAFSTHWMPLPQPTEEVEG
jgi:hypothetical protein